MILDGRTAITTLAVTLSLGAVVVVHAGDRLDPQDVGLVSCASTAGRSCGVDRRLHPDRTSPVPAPVPAPAKH